MPMAFEIDEKGRTILTNGIAFGPPAPQLQIVDLLNGDVLIWYSNQKHCITTAIQEFSGGPFSHVGIYIGNGLSMDAGPDGVSVTPVAGLINGFAYGRVMRKPGGLSVLQRIAVVQAALSYDKRHYAWMDAITLPARRRAYYYRLANNKKFNLVALLGRGLIELRRILPPSSKKTFCSRMVIEAYANIGYLLKEHSLECAFTPYDLAVQGIFDEEGWLCNIANPSWHPLDPYSPNNVCHSTWVFEPTRILWGK